MRPSPVTNRKLLQKRLQRFWGSGTRRRYELRDFVEHLRPIGQAAVLGGMIRDFARAGSNAFCSDVDLVIATGNRLWLENEMSQWRSSRNRFGGWRIRLDHWDVDVWCVEDTWAFVHGYVSGATLRDLTRTTFFNWDAAIFEIDSGELHLGDGYIEAVGAGILDINLQVNPNALGMAMRTWRLMRIHDAAITSRLAVFVVEALSNSSDQVLERYLGSARYGWVTKQSLNWFSNLLRKHIEDPHQEYLRLPDPQDVFSFDSVAS